MIKSTVASKWNHLRVGLVLSGGGAKGAYEAGVIRAMDELSLLPLIKCVSGTSIGALNTMFLAFCGERITDVWDDLSFTDVMSRNEKLDMKTIRTLIKTAAANDQEDIGDFTAVLASIGHSDQALFTLNGVREFARRYTDFPKLRGDGRKYFACAYDTVEFTPRYFHLNEMSDDEIQDIVLASASIPYVFPPIEINGIMYSDGGCNIVGSSVPNADNSPVLPLVSEALDVIIIVYLKHLEHARNLSLVRGSRVIELFPSEPLESVRGAGTMNFSKKAIRSHLELGYRDAMLALAPIVMAFLSGRGVDGLISRLNERNAALMARYAKISDD